MLSRKPASSKHDTVVKKHIPVLLILTILCFLVLLVTDLSVLHGRVASFDPQGGSLKVGGPAAWRSQLRENKLRKTRLVSRIAFGSCTAREYVPQPIWKEGVEPSDPHVWIWGGDLAYLDWPDADCRKDHSNPACNCTRDWLRSSRFSCLSGDLPHAQLKLAAQLGHPDYRGFLEFMCPAWRGGDGSGVDVPDGSDPTVCERLVLGTWDDHDYNWQDGNRRLPTRDAQKQLFLDALGWPPDSPRRNPGRGLYWKHTLNEGLAGKEVDVLLLDGRFHRDPKPCSTRRDFCMRMALKSPAKDKYAWCQDFLEGGPDKKGSCCRKDEELFSGWCQEARSKEDPLWSEACDPTAAMYGSSSLELLPPDDLGRRKLARRSPLEGSDEEESLMCDVLGPVQRQWLRHALMSSSAPLKLVVVGSPVFNNPGKQVCKGRPPKEGPPVECPCFDDFDCYRPAQIHLLHTLASAPGCAVVLTGDFHFSDIKVLRGGSQPYSVEYQSGAFTHPLYQVMASGLTTDTARNASCDGYHVDKMGLRHPSQCAFTAGPAFGMVEIAWSDAETIVKLQIRSGASGLVENELRFDLSSCQLV